MIRSVCVGKIGAAHDAAFRSATGICGGDYLISAAVAMQALAVLHWQPS